MNKTGALQYRYDAGNQMWFSAEKRFGQDCRIHHYGCGVIAMLDFCIYKGLAERPKNRQEYMNRIRCMERRWMHIIPGFGISPYFYAFFANLYFRFHYIPYRFRKIWVSGSLKMREEKFAKRIREQLKEDLPLIFAVGPVVPWSGKKGRITLYRLYGEKLIASGQKVKSHYMTILGLQRENDQWYLQLATWGEIRYMRLADYVQHGKFSFPFTNTIYETRIIQK